MPGWPARIAGRMSGKVTCQKVSIGRAPRSAEASSRLRGNWPSLATTLFRISVMQNVRAR